MIDILLEKILNFEDDIDQSASNDETENTLNGLDNVSMLYKLSHALKTTNDCGIICKPVQDSLPDRVNVFTLPKDVKRCVVDVNGTGFHDDIVIDDEGIDALMQYGITELASMYVCLRIMTPRISNLREICFNSCYFEYEDELKLSKIKFDRVYENTFNCKKLFMEKCSMRLETLTIDGIEEYHIDKLLKTKNLRIVMNPYCTICNDLVKIGLLEKGGFEGNMITAKGYDKFERVAYDEIKFLHEPITALLSKYFDMRYLKVVHLVDISRHLKAKIYIENRAVSAIGLYNK